MQNSSTIIATNRLNQLTNHLTASSTATSELVSIDPPNGGLVTAQALYSHGVRQVYTLTGGHISPILVGCNKSNIRVIDVRHEATAVFAADATSRLSGIVGIAIVTAGPGLTNTVTAVKNAQLAQSPVIILCGATSGLLKGRGSLQDIDQLACMRPHCKLLMTITAVREIIPAIDRAFTVSVSGVPGPVLIEFLLDTIWDRSIVADLLGIKTMKQPEFQLTKPAIQSTVQYHYLNYYFNNIFNPKSNQLNSVRSVVNQAIDTVKSGSNNNSTLISASTTDIDKVCQYLSVSERPLILIGSQAIRYQSIKPLITAIELLNLPIYLSGMGRGLLGPDNKLQQRHNRKSALSKADLVLLIGSPADFRLDYGRHINNGAVFITVNLDYSTLYKNNDIRQPKLRILAHPDQFLIQLSRAFKFNQSIAITTARKNWDEYLQQLQIKREKEIDLLIKSESTNNIIDNSNVSVNKPMSRSFVNPLKLLKSLDGFLSSDAILIGDGGDFVGAASYTIRPRKPLSWLDPGVFGTLGCGAGFALAAAAIAGAAGNGREVWAIFGDGSFGYSLIEFDTFSRLHLPIIAVIGNDACWSQMYRDQIRLLKDTTATELAYTDYHLSAAALGSIGILVNNDADIIPAFTEAVRQYKLGRSVVINCLIAKSTFREGSISL